MACIIYNNDDGEVNMLRNVSACRVVYACNGNREFALYASIHSTEHAVHVLKERAHDFLLPCLPRKSISDLVNFRLRDVPAFLNAVLVAAVIPRLNFRVKRILPLKEQPVIPVPPVRRTRKPREPMPLH